VKVLLFVGTTFRGSYKWKSMGSWIRGFKHYK